MLTPSALATAAVVEMKLMAQSMICFFIQVNAVENHPTSLSTALPTQSNAGLASLVKLSQRSLAQADISEKSVPSASRTNALATQRAPRATMTGRIAPTMGANSLMSPVAASTAAAILPMAIAATVTSRPMRMALPIISRVSGLKLCTQPTTRRRMSFKAVSAGTASVATCTASSVIVSFSFSTAVKVPGSYCEATATAAAMPAPNLSPISATSLEARLICLAAFSTASTAFPMPLMKEPVWAVSET
jgi:hypothetical protein